MRINKSTRIDYINFDFKQELKVLKAISKIFNSYPSDETPLYFDLLDGKDYGILDPSNCIMIIPHSVRMKKLMLKFMSKDDLKGLKYNKIPDLKYIINDITSGLEIKSCYDLRILQKILSCFESIGVINLRCYMSHDYPITLKSDDFTFILAPRID
jgi:hypothetical protein